MRSDEFYEGQLVYSLATGNVYLIVDVTDRGIFAEILENPSGCMFKRNLPIDMPNMRPYCPSNPEEDIQVCPHTSPEKEV